MTAAGTRALDLVARAGIAHHVHAYTVPERHGRARDDRPNYGTEAAAALDVDPARVFKTLVVTVDDRLVLAVVPVDRELDLKRLAAAVGGRRASMAEPAQTEWATGSVVGGISPLGSQALPVIVDASALLHATVLVSAGRRGLQLELAPDDLVRLTGAGTTHVARDDGPG